MRHKQSHNSEKRKYNIFDADLETGELIEQTCEISLLAQANLPQNAPSRGTTSTKIAH
jgi:hypothetical protein